MNPKGNPNPNIGSSLNLNPQMYKNENNASFILQRRVFIVVIVLLCIVIGVLIYLKARPCSYDSQKEIDKLNDEIRDLNKESLNMAKELYVMAKDVVGDIYLDTKRICAPFIFEYDRQGKIVPLEFNQSGSSKFVTYQDFINYVRARFTGTVSSTILSSTNYKNQGGKLYCVDSSRNPNNKYIGLESIVLVHRGLEKNEYTVKEKYFAEGESIDCLEDCNYEYKENKFTIEFINGVWLVSEFTLPF